MGTLTRRQGSAYPGRKTACHPCSAEHLGGHLQLLRCYYNFVRPHLGHKFGPETRTPAMQAGLVARRLTFRDVFMAVTALLSFVAALIGVRWRGRGLVPNLTAA